MYYMFHKVVLILSATESILIVQQEAGRGKTGEIHLGSRQQCTVRSVLLIAAQFNSCRVKYHSALFTIQWRFSSLKQNKTFQHLTN